jgi:hypothetical protein
MSKLNVCVTKSQITILLSLAATPEYCRYSHQTLTETRTSFHVVSRRKVLAGMGAATIGAITGCISSGGDRENWVQIWGHTVINETDSQQEFQIGISDAGTPVSYTTSTSVDANSRKEIQDIADIPSDYWVAASVGDQEAVVKMPEVVDADAECAVSVIRLDESQDLTVSGDGYQECPTDTFGQSETATQ